MNINITLQEKLRDLREERKLRLVDVSKATGIPTSTLQRFESDGNVRIGYQEVEVLTRFYEVSADYLFGLTDNRQHRHIEVDSLRLSDSAIETLKGDKLNNRLMSELISHPDFPRLMSAIEVYIDRKVLPQMSTINAIYKVAESEIKEKFEAADNDEMISFLQEIVVSEDEYLRYRISERFNALMKRLFDIHKKDALPDEQASLIKEMKAELQDFPAKKEKEERARWKMGLLAKQIGLNIKNLTDEQTAVLMEALKDSDLYKKSRGHGKRRK